MLKLFASLHLNIFNISVANESRPSSGDVDDGSGAADEANSSGRITRNRQQNRTSKRKYEDLSGVQHPAGDVAVSSGSLDHHHHLAEANPNHSGASNSNEGAGSIQLMQSEHPDHQQHSEAMDAARAWKRLYAGMDQHHNESIQVNNPSEILNLILRDAKSFTAGS